MFCPRCGKGDDNEAKFCQSCGFSLQGILSEQTKISYCPRCGIELKEGYRFCSSCGTALEGEVIEAKKRTEDKICGIWMRRISGFFGAFALMTAPVGWRWYFESRLPLVFFSEFLGLLIGISLLLFGLFPDNICKKLGIFTADKYNAIIIILILVWFMVVEIEPEPPGGWWNY